MVIHLTAGFLPAARRLAARMRPIPGTGRDRSRPGRQPGVPVWPCTAWGLSCPGSCPPGGGLLPRLFTLAARPLRAARRYVLCDTFHRPGLSPRPSANFSRHAALWCSDFPLPPRRERPSTRPEYSRSSRRAQAENFRGSAMGPMGLIRLMGQLDERRVRAIGPGNHRKPGRVLFLASRFVECST